MVVTYASKEEWLEGRRSLITATQAAILWSSHLGWKLWPDSTPFSVWQEKIEGTWDSEENVHQWFGKAMELPVCKWAAEELGAELEFPEPYTMVVRDDAPWMGCTPDAWLRWPNRRSILQAKTASHITDWGETGTTQVPGAYLAQESWEMACCQELEAYLAVLLTYAVDGYKGPKVTKDRRWYRFQRVPAIEQLLVSVCWNFKTRYLDTGFPPPRKTQPGWLADNMESAA